MKKHSFYIYGKKPIEEQILKDPGNILRIFISDSLKGNSEDVTALRAEAKTQRIPINAISRKKIQEYVGEVNDQGMIALLREAKYTTWDEWFGSLDLESQPSVLILDQIQDTHNFGAIIRTASAVGISGIIVAKDNQAPLNGTVFKTSAGTVIKIPIVQVSNINQTILKLQKNKFWVTAVDIDQDRSIGLWDQTHDTSMAFVLGSEGKGVSEKIREKCDFVTSIPMENDVESLNVSVAAALVMYEWKRQQK